MEVVILHIDECPNWEEAGARVRVAFDASGPTDTDLELTLLTSPKDAKAVVFAGSPTILLDGIDALPSVGRISALACRVYRTETGLAGAPTVAQLSEAIQGKL